MIITHKNKTYDIPEDVLAKYEVKNQDSKISLPTIDVKNRNGYDWLDMVAARTLCYHPGRDFNRGSGNQDLGDPVFAIADGKVTYYQKEGGWGNHMYILHENIIHPKYGKIKKFWSHYAHLKDSNVKVGDTVKSGDRIASVGNTGTVFAHLHLEIQKDKTSWQPTFYPCGKSKDWVIDNYYSPDDFLGIKS